MTREPMSPSEREQRDLDRVDELLGGYARSSADLPSPGFADRVMESIGTQPAPRRGIAGWLAAVVGGSGALRSGLLVATMIAAFAVVALAGGFLADRGPNVGTTPSPGIPTQSAVPSPSASPTPSPTSTPRATPPETPEPSETDKASPSDPEDDSTPTQKASPSQTEDDHGGNRSETPRPTQSDDGGGEGGGSGHG